MTPEQEEVLREIQAGMTVALHRIDELRTEVSELEATNAELAEQVRQLGELHWPWPLSLLSRLESILPGLPELPRR